MNRPPARLEHRHADDISNAKRILQVHAGPETPAQFLRFAFKDFLDIGSDPTTA